MSVVTVLQEILNERDRQDRKWGMQNHPDGTVGDPWYKEYRDMVREECDQAAHNGTVTWNHILTEEIAEARCEVDPVPLREELIQCAAVIVAWIESIDRRTK